MWMRALVRLDPRTELAHFFYPGDRDGPMGYLAMRDGNKEAITTRSQRWIAQTNLPSKEASLLVYAGITAMDQFKLFCPEELRLVDSLLDKTECTGTAPEGGKQETEDAAITTVADEVEEVAAGGASLKGTAKTKRATVGVFRCSFCLLCEDCCAAPSSCFSWRPPI